MLQSLLGHLGSGFQALSPHHRKKPELGSNREAAVLKDGEGSICHEGEEPRHLRCAVLKDAKGEKKNMTKSDEVRD